MFGLKRRRHPAASAPLYAAAVAVARDPDWFTCGAVPDTVDGRFDMLALVLALIIARLQREHQGQTEADLTDRFVEDMDGSLREIGVGDLSITKQVGRTVSALGGRIGIYSAALAADNAALADALGRNLYRGTPPAPDALAWAVTATRALAARIEAPPIDRLLAGTV